MTTRKTPKTKVLLALGAAALGLGAAHLLHARPSTPAGGNTVKSYDKPDQQQLKKRLTPLQYQVTQEEGTEPPFKNEYWDSKEEGIYVDVVSGEPLFSSLHKYASGTGWPSFYRALRPGSIVQREDTKLWQRRVEVRSKGADSHLGHLFDDGPAPTGKRYCINSAALRFVPVARLAAEGYGEFLADFGRPAGGKAEREVATLAGGCFWGVEELMRKLPGVIETSVGYTGGTTPRPTYQTVSSGRTGHAEAVEVLFDPDRVSYREILRYFFRLHDPTTPNRQGNDRGTQYRSAVFVHDAEQARIAQQVIKEVDGSGKWPRPVVTEVVQAKAFYPAESYHQDYLQKNPGGYTCHFLRD